MPTTPPPPSGWLSVEHGIIGLNGTPPVTETIPLAFQVATRVAHARPSDDLIDWFGAHRNDPLTWTSNDTAALVRLVRAHEPEAWTLLDETGLLGRVVPEFAEALHRRRADGTDVESPDGLRFHVAERLDDLAVETGHPSDDLVLAAMATDVSFDAPDPHSCSIGLLGRLMPTAKAQQIAAIVDDARLLRASSSDRGGFDEREVLQLATHLADPARVRDAYQLALALGSLPTWHREALDHRHAVIQQLLDHPGLTGGEAINLAAGRRLSAQRLVTGRAAIERLRFAPTAYVLSHNPDELARQARLVDPLPRSGTVRVEVSPGSQPEQWKIDVACRDSGGLLAHLTDVLTSRDLHIVDATIATWPDGAVLDTFVVGSANLPVEVELSRDFAASLRKPLRPPVALGLSAAFDNEALPWHTACDVTGRDQAGALSAVSAAFARAKVVVHTARIATTDGIIHDRFTISDRIGRKLGAPEMERVRRAIAGDRVGRRLSFSR